MAGRDIDGKGGAPSASPPVAKNGIGQRQHRNRRRVGAHDPRAERHGNDERLAEKPLGVRLPKTRLRARSERRAGLAAILPSDSIGIGAVFVLVAVNELSGRIPPGQGILQPDGLMNLGNSKNAALLGRLDDIGPHPFGR